MTILATLTSELQAHWTVHLKALGDEFPTAKTIVKKWLSSSTDLPNIRHPSYVHDWWEYPELRTEIEAWD